MSDDVTTVVTGPNTRLARESVINVMEDYTGSQWPTHLLVDNPASEGVSDDASSPSSLEGTLLTTCTECGRNTVTTPCRTCQPITHFAHLAPAEVSETNEADRQAWLDDVADDPYSGERRIRDEPPANPVHGCAGPTCRTWGCDRGKP